MQQMAMDNDLAAIPDEHLHRFIVVDSCRLILCPIAKSASTLLKRLAVILQGQTPVWQSSTWESKPALAVHDRLINGLRTLADYSPQDRARILTSSDWIRLAVTRHPAERLVSFWFDKLYLQEPAYQQLSGLIQRESSEEPSVDSPGFEEFLKYLEAHWDLLSQDCHLAPQVSQLCLSSVSYSHLLDRSELFTGLLPLLSDRSTQQALTSLQQELSDYRTFYHQDLISLWPKLYSSRSLDLIQRLYRDDFTRFSSYLARSADQSESSVSPSLIQACLADSCRQVQERNQQIGALQAEIRRLQAQLDDPSAWLGLPALPAALPGQLPVVQHHTDHPEFEPLYQWLASGQADQLLERTAQLLESGDWPEQWRGELFYLQGVANNILGQHESALRLFELAQESGFLTAYVLFNGGNSCRNLGFHQEAQRLFGQALELLADFPECRHNLCLSYYDCKDYRRAEVGFRLLLRDHPSYFQASFCLGNLLRDLKRYPEAIEAYKLAIEHGPTYLDAWNNLGLAYGDLGRTDLAISAYLHCLSIDAAFPHARQNLAQAYILKKDYLSALVHFELLAHLNYGVNQNVLALQGQISCLLELGRYDDALERADSCSQDERIRLMARLHVLPVLYDSTEQLNVVRARWSADLKRLQDLLADLSASDEAYPLLWSHAWSLTNFYLAYQMQNDRELQQIYASCLSLILGQRLAEFMQPRPARSAGDQSPLRIGIISPHLRNHNGSIWALGWLESLARNPSYQLFSYNVGDQEDEGTQRFARLGTYRHLPLSPDDPMESLRLIQSDDLDVLLFTDIGMHPRSKVLSVLKLARVQAQGWGHPVTSGSDCIDYYLSGADMELATSDDHYTETLWRLPSTGLVYERPVAVHDGTCLYEKLNLPSDRPLLLSLQSTFKYVPEYDHIFARIIKNNPNVLILFAGHMGCQVIADRFFDRLAVACKQHGIDAARTIRILPRLDYADFMGLFSIAHHTLDTIGWNGGNSSFQSFSLHCPVVTLPTEFMRGRHTVSMLNKMGINELIAGDIEEYISICGRLLDDADFYHSIKARIAQTEPLLFSDMAVASAFEAFIACVCPPLPA